MCIRDSLGIYISHEVFQDFHYIEMVCKTDLNVNRSGFVQMPAGIVFFCPEDRANFKNPVKTTALMSGGFDRVFEIGPIFRAEEHDTRRHLNEATSIDVEVSFADHFDVMEILENLVAYI